MIVSLPAYIPRKQNTISSALIFNIFEMLPLHLFHGVREKQRREWEGKGAKRNWTWGEWVGDQRAAVAELGGEDQGPQCGDTAHGCHGDEGKEGGPDRP